tara:strand:+ start:15887 stop:16714 length:828 start_codon:yes stop_codon:yes gene_type:complete
MQATDKKQIIRPPLKWAGGKTRLLPEIHAVLPAGKRLVEPFLGSGTVFFNTDYERYWLNDINQDLILFYQTLKDQGEKFIKRAKYYFSEKHNTAEQYYMLRERFNRSRPSATKAALFLYLNRHTYNGLCRYNKSGGFNSPYGKYKKPYFPEKEMVAFHEKLQRAKLTCLSFVEVMRKTKVGDVVYCDPPYVPLTPSANFTQYHQHGFDEDKQLALASLAEWLAEKEISTVISNHDTPFTRKIYQQAKLKKFKVRRFISCNGKKRNYANELLASFS